MIKPPQKYIWLERIGYVLGLILAISLWLALTMLDAKADTALVETLPFLTPSMLIATLTGAVGSFLAFGEDKKIPPSATSIGHILLGFGAGLFFTRGSLELMGYLEASDDVVILAAFLWAALGYFALRLGVSIIQSDQIASMLPNWLVRIIGAQKNDSNH